MKYKVESLEEYLNAFEAIKASDYFDSEDLWDVFKVDEDHLPGVYPRQYPAIVILRVTRNTIAEEDGDGHIIQSSVIFMYPDLILNSLTLEVLLQEYNKSLATYGYLKDQMETSGTITKPVEELYDVESTITHIKKMLS